MADESFEVQRTILADPASIFAVVSDPQGHVAIDASGMLQSASGDRAKAVGDEFVVHMDREALNDFPLGLYDVTVKIVTFEPDREIAWTILGAIQPPIGHVYGYRLEPADEGTLVTSYYDWSNIDPVWRERNIFPIISELALPRRSGSSTGPSSAAIRRDRSRGKNLCRTEPPIVATIGGIVLTQMTRTFCASSPLRPGAMSNSTR